MCTEAMAVAATCKNCTITGDQELYTQSDNLHNKFYQNLSCGAQAETWLHGQTFPFL